jgi:lysophospholipase L1-like esterase
MKKLISLFLFLLITSPAFANIYGANLQGASVGREAAIVTCVGASSCRGSQSTSGFGMRDRLQVLLGNRRTTWAGDRLNPASDDTHDVRHWGIDGRTIDTINADIDVFLDNYFPSPVPEGTTIITHMGGADIFNESEAPSSVEDKADQIFDKIRAHDSDINIIFSTTQPLGGTDTGTVNDNLRSYHSLVEANIQARVTAGDNKIFYYDLHQDLRDYPGFPSSVLDADNVHQNDTGYQVWADGVYAIFETNIHY